MEVLSAGIVSILFFVKQIFEISSLEALRIKNFYTSETFFEMGEAEPAFIGKTAVVDAFEIECFCSRFFGPEDSLPENLVLD